MSARVVMLYSMSFQPFQGWYRRVFNQAKALVDAGCDVTLLAWDREGTSPAEEDRQGVQIKRFHIPAGTSVGPKNGINHLRFHRAVYGYLKRNEFDVVHCFNVDTMPIGLWAAKRRRRKSVLDLCEPEYYRGFWKKRYSLLLKGVNRVERAMARRFDHLFVHNEYQVNKFQACGISRLTQVGSYPDASLLNTEMIQPTRDAVVVGRLGTAYANNGFEEVATAFRQLLDRQCEKNGHGRNFKLRLAGNVFDNYREQFNALVEPLGDAVEHTGAFDVSELAELYREIDISILLYGRESFRNVTPTKLFESLACGVPVVANDIGEVAQIVREGNCGVIVDERDPESICRGIEEIASHEELRRTMSENAVNLVREKYTWDVARESFLDAYSTIIELS